MLYATETILALHRSMHADRIESRTRRRVRRSTVDGRPAAPSSGAPAVATK